MPTKQEVTSIVDKVKERLTKAKGEGIHLKVAGEKLDDGWLYVVVVPTKSGVRASDHASLMSKIERELRVQGDDQVLLVPALEE